MKVTYVILRIAMFFCAGFGIYLILLPADFTTAFGFLLPAVILFSVSSMVRQHTRYIHHQRTYVADRDLQVNTA